MKYLKKFENNNPPTREDWVEEQTNVFFTKLDEKIEDLCKHINIAFNKTEFLSEENKIKTIEQIDEFNEYVKRRCNM